MMLLKVILFVALILVALTFAYFNLDMVNVSFFSYSVQLPLFLVVMGSFIVGFVASGSVGLLRRTFSRDRGEKLLRALNLLWRGYPSKAGRELKKLEEIEEVIPLIIEVDKQLNRTPSVYMQRYSQGIAEVYFAKYIWREDLNRSVELLETALGKNWDNLKAKRFLRDLYTLKGDFKKALDLQKVIVKECEKDLKSGELSVLADLKILSEETEDVGDLPLTVLSLAYLIRTDDRKRKKYIDRAIESGLFEEVLCVLVEWNDLVPEILEKVEQMKGSLGWKSLLYLFLNLGMLERLKDIEDLPKGLKELLEDNAMESKSCRDELIKNLRIWECGSCGKDFVNYSPMCNNCLTWHKLKIKGGSQNAYRLQ